MAGSRDKRISGRRLQKIRRDFFAANPICAKCAKRVATQLDHIKPLFMGGTDTHDNRQGLCVPCHEAKTLSEMGIVKGCDERGVPIDPNHHWRK